MKVKKKLNAHNIQILFALWNFYPKNWESSDTTHAEAQPITDARTNAYDSPWKCMGKGFAYTEVHEVPWIFTAKPFVQSLAFRLNTKQESKHITQWDDTLYSLAASLNNNKSPNPWNQTRIKQTCEYHINKEEKESFVWSAIRAVCDTT